MHRKYRAIALILLTCFMNACVQNPDVEERNGIKIAATNDLDNGIAEDMSEISRHSTEMIDNIPQNTHEGSIKEKNLKILAECKNVKIEKKINVSDEQTLFIDADIDVGEIDQISRYEYILKGITEEIRENIFQAVFEDMANQAAYDERNDVWTLEIEPQISNYFQYQISYSNGGSTVPGEQIVVLANTHYNLYPFEDNRLTALSECKVDIAPDEAINICEQVMKSIAGIDNYAIDYIQAYGNKGRRPYYKIVFKRTLDGMPITGYNDFIFLLDDDGIERVTGSLFSIEEKGLEKIILSPDEAAERLQKQADFINFGEETQTTVSKITLEYFLDIFPAGEMLITPVWRFLIGEDEAERNFFRHKILAVDAVTGELIWEERGTTM